MNSIYIYIGTGEILPQKLSTMTYTLISENTYIFNSVYIVTCTQTCTEING